MKAERRHELQQSDLAKVIKGAPSFWQQSGGRWLIAAVAVLVIALLIRYRMNSSRVELTQAEDRLAIARGATSGLGEMAPYIQFAPPDQLASQRNAFYADANAAILEAAEASDDPKIQAEALVARGDLDWALATMPQIPGATTRPSLLFRKEPKELFTSASESYKAVLDNFSNQLHSAVAARFGLAAIAENRREYDAAKTQYDKILVDARDYPSYVNLANERLRVLTELRNPAILATPATTQAVADVLVPPTTAPAGPLAPVPATTQTAAAALPAPAATAPTTATTRP